MLKTANNNYQIDKVIYFLAKNSHTESAMYANTSFCAQAMSWQTFMIICNYFFMQSLQHSQLIHLINCLSLWYIVIDTTVIDEQSLRYQSYQQIFYFDRQLFWLWIIRHVPLDTLVLSFRAIF